MQTVETCNKIALTDARLMSRLPISELLRMEWRLIDAIAECDEDSEAIRLLRRGRQAILAEMRRR